MVTLVRDNNSAAIPTAMIAPGTTENEPVISATMIMTASGARETLPKHAIIATTTKMPGSWGTPGSSVSSPSRQIAAPTKAPITIPGPNSPPDPPVPIDSDVARILAIGKTMTIHNGMLSSVPRSAASCAQP
ncbi:Uncharacterised protein [Mycobacterium tuberculosis]|nr:Uncharacterised protein [Mycobacterium tuberculosis]COU87591.1 Uncharacterised protein [Mycobacterium tuberculosis]COV80621.1 Uncharacterised protein [Mycobacterium tuberculosis]